MEQSIKGAVAEKLAAAGLYATKQQVQLRVLRDIVEKVMKMDMTTVYELKTLTFIPLDILERIGFIWNKYRTDEVTNEDVNLVQKILHRDYHRQSDLTRLANILYKKTNPEGQHLLNIVFAVDGYNGSEYKNYIAHLGNNDIYCNAVRRLYEEQTCTPDKVHEAIVNAFRGNVDTALAVLFRQSIGDQFEIVAEAKQKEMEKKSAVNKKRKNEE